jgi:hypothetical protein
VVMEGHSEPRHDIRNEEPSTISVAMNRPAGITIYIISTCDGLCQVRLILTPGARWVSAFAPPTASTHHLTLTRTIKEINDLHTQVNSDSDRSPNRG